MHLDILKFSCDDFDQVIHSIDVLLEIGLVSNRGKMLKTLCIISIYQ